MSSEQAQQWVDQGVVHAVHEDSSTKLHAESASPAAVRTQVQASWNLDRLDQPRLPLDGTYKYIHDGSGVTVYVLDTVRFLWNPFCGTQGGVVQMTDDAVSKESHDGNCTHVVTTGHSKRPRAVCAAWG